MPRLSEDQAKRIAQFSIQFQHILEQNELTELEAGLVVFSIAKRCPTPLLEYLCQLLNTELNERLKPELLESLIDCY